MTCGSSLSVAACAIDTSALPVNHCSQSSAFTALNREAREARRKARETRRKARETRRKARETRRDGKMASQAEQQHNVNSAGQTVN